MQSVRMLVAFAALLGCGTALALAARTFGPSPIPLAIPESYQGKDITLKTWLQTPGGQGPFNTVVLVPGCDGLDRFGWVQMQTWASWLLQLNYAVLMIDSFTPRGVTNVCDNGGIVPGELHAADVYTAAAYLSHLPQMHGGKFAAIGFSHGGWGVLEIASDRMPGIVDLRAKMAEQNVEIAAVAAMYPACYRHVRENFSVPILILIGAKDDWTYARLCERLAAFPRVGGQVILKVYPNAYHVFDVDKPPRRYFGHELEYDATATADARYQIREFFARWMR